MSQHDYCTQFTSSVLEPHQECFKGGVVRGDEGRDGKFQAHTPTPQYLDKGEMESCNVRLLSLLNVLL